MPKNSNSKFFFKNRSDAANQLIDDMPIQSLREQSVTVIAISDGAVVIADRVARALDAPMDVLLSDAVYAPNNPELPIAMVSETQTMVMNRVLVDAFEINEDYVYSEAQRRYDDQVLSHVYRYRHGEPICSVEGRVVILVDECVETGITTLMAIKSMIEQRATNVYIAVPILDVSVHDNLVSACDGVFCPHTIRDYISIEYYYQTLEKPTFEAIERILHPHE
jgi:putative phosphoribosyl transferase